MAIVKLGSFFNATNPGSYDVDDVGSGMTRTAGPNGFTISDSTGRSVSVAGVGMGYAADGDWVTGVATAVTMTNKGQLILEATGLSIEASSDAYDRGYAGEAPGMQSELAYWLRGNDTITGSTGAEYLKGYGGNDIIGGGASNDVIDGGVGIDTAVYAGNASNYTVTKSSSNYIVNGGTDGGDTLLNVERIKFADKLIAFDTNGNAGQAYRLYQAAFDRKPDLAGLGTWIDLMDKGMSLAEVSSYFQRSDEFKALYGTNVTNEQFVDLLYKNVLDRTPDAGGYTTWKGVLDAKTWTREQVLIGFSESNENQVKVIGSIQNGIEFIPAS